MQPPGHDHRSPGGETAAFSIADERAAVRLRHRIRVLLGAWHLRDLADSVADLVAVTVLAATPHPRRRADVRLRVRDGVLRGEVRGDHMFPVDTAPACLALDGGLRTVLAARSDRWGCDTSTSGSLVWFELHLPAASSRSRTSARLSEEATPERPGLRSQDRRRAQPPSVLPPAGQEDTAAVRRRRLRRGAGTPVPFQRRPL